MTKEELIESYHSLNLSSDVFLGFSSYSVKSIIIGVVLSVLAIAFWCFIFRYNKQKMSIKFMIAIPATMIGIQLIFVILYEVFVSPTVKQSDEFAKLLWYREVFVDKYLPSQDRSRVLIRDYRVQPNGKVNVVLDDGESAVIIKDLSNFTYTEDEDSYLEAVWVDGLEDYSIESDFYSVEAKLVKKGN
ncbi:MAG: hypothetical protein ACE3L7_32800 [Candidatus Pristimantibacillus sp.]